MGEVREGQVTVFEESAIPVRHSLGPLCSKVTRYLGFMPNDDEYKVMGLSAFAPAPAGVHPLVKHVVKPLPHGRHELSLDNVLLDTRSYYPSFAEVDVSFGASDPGIALGAGFHPAHLAGQRPGATGTPYLGPAHDTDTARDARKTFRPFAPVVPESLAPRVFERGKKKRPPHTTFVFPVRKDYRKSITGAVHVDGTARIRTISEKRDPTLAQLLGIFERTTGMPCLLNTSFNVAEEPMVSSPRMPFAASSPPGWTIWSWMISLSVRSKVSDMPATVAVHARPFCLFHQAGVTRLATGEIKRVELLADLPRPTGLPIISMVPYAQLKERGFELHDGGEAILSLVVDECREVDLEAMMDTTDPDFTVGEVSFGMTDDEFTDIIRRIIEDEICQGEGSNFLISRRGRVRIEGFSSEVAKTVFRRLVRNELGAYFTFCFFDGERYFIGSSPERHITFTGETVVMNPICGTLPKTAINSRADLVDFLTDPKEVNELFQVVDEELKMMARICSEGGVVKGPYLKEMGAVVHTEYLLEGHSTMDKIDAFRDSMFAATMVGSPLENAARIIRKYEHESRRYYSSAIMVHGLDEDGADYLDSAITIRTMEISAEGDVLLQSGCSVVRDSSPEKETKEVQAKMAGLLRALRSTERTEPVLDRYVDDHVRRILTSRNAHLSRFWTDDQQGSVLTEPPARKSVLIVDNEDEFTHMLGHILSHLGLDVTVRDYDDPTLELGAADLVLIGPGPGDPRVDSDPKMRRVRQIVTELLDSRAKFIAVCLGHQIVSQQLGMDIVRIDPPLQGVQKQVDLFGQHELVGFYNTFFAERPQTAPADVEVATTPDGHVVALRAENYCTFQFHVESLLTSNCVSILRRALEWLR